MTAGVVREASLDLGFGSLWRVEMANQPGELDTESLRLWFQSVDTDNSNSINVDELQVRRIAMLVNSCGLWRSGHLEVLCIWIVSIVSSVLFFGDRVSNVSPITGLLSRVLDSGVVSR